MALAFDVFLNPVPQSGSGSGFFFEVNGDQGRILTNHHMVERAEALEVALARGLQLPVERGILVQRVSANSPAAVAGIRGGTQRVRVGNSVLAAGGDVILRVDGREVRVVDGVDLYLDRAKRPGDTVTLEILRDGATQSVQVRAGESPGD